MHISLAFVADEANLSQEGKLNVLGVFDRLVARQFPVLHPRMVFVFRLSTEFADAGTARPVVVRLVDEDGSALFEAQGEVRGPDIPPGSLASLNHIFNLVGVEFARPGAYKFVIRLGTSTFHEVPLFVLALEEGSEEQA